MSRPVVVLFLALGVASLALAQSSSSLSNSISIAHPIGSVTPRTHHSKKQEKPMKPFSQIGLEAGISSMGVNLQAATNIDRHLNLRVLGNVFDYAINNIPENGFNVDADLNLATAGLSVDYYPFPTHGLRISPGMLFYNQNSIKAIATVSSGLSFTLNNVTYYSSSANPVQGTATVGFNTQKPIFTLTTGWGNLISRTGSHFSFPFEIGAAFVGSPTVNIVLPQGQVCAFPNTNCMNVLADSILQTNLQAQISQYRNDFNPLHVYPILSFGIGYSFHIR